MKSFTLLLFLSISFFGFSQTKNFNSSDFQITGDAKLVDDDCFRLTEAIEWQGGSVWYKNPIDLSESFEMEIDVMLGCQDQGADGIVFIFHSKLKTGFQGEGMGFGGLRPSLGIEMDTYENHHLLDPDFDHIAVMKNGRLSHRSGITVPRQLHSSKKNIEDCAKHRIKINWQPSEKKLQVFFDGSRRVNVDIDIINEIFEGNSTVYWGFSGATGGFHNKQDVWLEKLDFTTIGSFDNETKQLLLDGKNYTLKDIEFTSGRSELSDASDEELEKLVFLLKENKELNVYISGHTDSVGNASRNKSLSKKRADAVKKYLIENGINPKRISSSGYGEKFPIGNNNSAIGREQNRRVDIYLLKPRA